MKKLILLLIVILVLLGGYKKLHTQTTPTQTVQLTKQEQTQFKDYQAEQKRLEQLQKLQNPQYVEGKLRNVGKLTTLEGIYTYQDTITQKGLWDYVTLKQMTLNLQYQYGLGVSLEYIKVAQVLDEGKTIIINIPKERIQLQYLQLLADKSTIKDGKKMIFVSRFKPSDVKSVIELSQQNVANKIGSNRKLFDTAMGNLKGQLDDFCKSLGYSKTIFEEV